MHPLMKHRKKWGPHILKWPRPISLSFSKNVFSNSVFYMRSKKQLGDAGAFGTMFSIHRWVKRQSAACPPSNDKRMAVETSSLGEKMRCYSQRRHGAEKVGERTKMCLFMPTGVLTLLQAAIAFCQERELKGHSPDVKTSTAFRPGHIHFLPPCTYRFKVSSDTK